MTLIEELSATGTARVWSVLDLDPDLGGSVDEGDWEAARRACRGAVVSVPCGVWELPGAAAEWNEVVAFLIVQGFVCREVALRDRYMFELLGPGDVLQLPLVSERPRLGGEIKLTVIAAMTLVALDGAFVRAAVRWPGLLASVHRRLETQRQQLAIQGLIAHLSRAEDRVLLALWHLAERWGRVTREGTVLPLPLSHDVLGQLAAARRPTATLAVSVLENAGYVRRLGDGSWLLNWAAQSKVEAIAAVRRPTPVLGETFRIHYNSAERWRESQALRGEARQTRAQPRADRGRPTH